MTVEERQANQVESGSWVEGTNLSQAVPKAAKRMLTRPAKVAGVIAYFVAAAAFATFLASAADPLRWLLEGLPLGDSVAERRRDEGEPVLLIAIGAALTAIGGFLLTRLRTKVVGRWLHQAVGREAVLAVWFARAAFIAFGVALTYIAAAIADGDDLRRRNETFDTGVGDGLLGLLVGLAVLAAWTGWRTWRLMKELSPEGRELPAILAARPAERPAPAGRVTGLGAGSTGIDREAWRERGEIRPARPGAESGQSSERGS